jgi:hypothetical protein
LFRHLLLQIAGANIAAVRYAACQISNLSMSLAKQLVKDDLSRAE